ncbi:MAG: hypothetical protein HRU26_08870 [Psychroserpens sp.]|nr:hypothetical protein [Psychroserpens sp.]
MRELGIDPSIAIPSEEDYKKAENVKEYVDPLVEKMNKLAQENLIAFRIADEGYDTVFNIGERWTYDMVAECLKYIEIKNAYQEREQRKADAQAQAKRSKR